MSSTDTLSLAVATNPKRVKRIGNYRSLWAAAWPSVVLAVLVLVVWEVVVIAFNISSFIIAKPSEILAELWLSRELLAEASIVTTQEILYGFLVSIVIGVVLALAIVRFRWLDRALYPLIVLFQVVPKVALAPIFILWFGYGMTPKLFLIVVIAFFPITLNMIVGLKSYDPDLYMLMKSVGSTRGQILTRIQFPTSIPYLMAGLRIAITLCVIGAVVAEFAGASSGLGYLIQFASTQLDTPLMFAALTVISVLGLVMYYAIYALELLVGKFYPHVTLAKAQ